jgi:hypothetical protein
MNLNHTKEESIEYLVMLSASTVALLTHVSSSVGNMEAIDVVIKNMEEKLFSLEYEVDNSLMKTRNKKVVMKRYFSPFLRHRFMMKTIKIHGSLFKANYVLRQIYANVYTYGMVYQMELSQKMSSNPQLFKQRKNKFYKIGVNYFKNNLNKKDLLINHVFRPKLSIGKL